MVPAGTASRWSWAGETGLWRPRGPDSPNNSHTTLVSVAWSPIERGSIENQVLETAIMLPNVLLASLSFVLLASAPGTATTAPTGTYLEARTTDVYTGPCFANSEEGLTGREATLAWSIETGSWDGIDLSGLHVVAVVRAEETLGDVHERPVTARSILLVDERADEAQRGALAAFAEATAGGVLGTVTGVEAAPVTLETSPATSTARLSAGPTVRLATRGLTHEDHICGNDHVFYPPLVTGVSAGPAVTTENTYTGTAFGGTWSSPGKRSAFLGTF